MKIKVGFVSNPRELVIAVEEGADRDALTTQLTDFLNSSEDNLTTTIEAAKGSRYILVRSQVAFIEIGEEEKRAVGFI